MAKLPPGWTEGQEGVMKTPQTDEDWANVIDYYQRTGNWQQVYKAWRGRAFLQIKTRYPNVKDTDIWEAIDLRMGDEDIKADVGKAISFVMDDVSEAPGAAPEPEPAPVYEYEETPEMKTLRETVAGIVSTGRPEFTPEYVTKWGETVGKMTQPFEEEAITKLREEYNVLSPHSYGSGTQMVAMGDLLEKMAANKATVALGLGEREYGRKLGEYTGAQQQQMDIADFLARAKKWESEQEMTDWLTEMQQKWATAEAERERLYGQKAMTDYLSWMRSNQPEWYEEAISSLLGGIGTGVGMYAGGWGTKKLGIT